MNTASQGSARQSWHCRKLPFTVHDLQGTPVKLFFDTILWKLLILMRRKLSFIALGILAIPLLAGEYVVLSNGFRIHGERHEKLGEMLLLYTKDGSIEVPSDAVASIEPDEGNSDVDSGTTPGIDSKEQLKYASNTHKLLTEAAIRNGLDPAIVHSVARVESSLNPNAVSPKGARGLMQVMPETAKQFNLDPNDPVQNVEAGARYLREMLQRYKGRPQQVKLALAAYNAGPGAVDRYNGIPPYPETRMYVEKVLRHYWRLKK